MAPTSSSGKPQFVKAGYWLADNSSSSTFPATNINTDLYTHIFCGFADMDPGTKSVIIPSAQQTQISTFSATIKQKGPAVKTLLSIGGKSSTANPKGFGLMASLASSRKTFIDSSITLARSYGFDGLDFQWLYPSNSTEMKNFSSLLHEWQDSIKIESQRQQKPHLLLVATVFYSPYNSNNDLYPINVMQKSLDWINVLAYDFYTPDSYTAETAPSAPYFNSNTTSLSVNYGIEQWVTQQNYPADDVVLGLPFHGWAWLLSDAKKNRAFNPANGPANGAGITTNGYVNYGKIKDLINQFAGKSAYESKDSYDYAYYQTNWFSYDDEKSIKEKITRAKTLNLLGYFASFIGGDDAYSTLGITATQQWDA